jgi:predicted GIY-YIG superfamily endonuclease
MYLVYIIVCDNLSYVGMTNNFLNRWLQHNGIISGGAKYTKKRCNWYPICIIDGFKNKSEAMQCEWKVKSRKPKLSRKFKYAKGRIQYLNLLLKDEKWTSKSPKIIDQNLTIYINKEYEDLIDSVITKELYWK